MSHVACTSGKQQTAATAGVVILANIPLDADGHPRFSNLFLNLPDFIRETAFIDRIHGILPGWKLRRIQEEAISNSVGFKADFFGEVLQHMVIVTFIWQKLSSAERKETLIVTNFWQLFS